MNFQEFKKGPEKDDDKREENTNTVKC
jgi:hypothetical protein